MGNGEVDRQLVSCISSVVGAPNLQLVHNGFGREIENSYSHNFQTFTFHGWAGLNWYKSVKQTKIESSSTDIVEQTMSKK